MSCSIRRLVSGGAALTVALALGVLAGCIGTRGVVEDIRYDFGPPAPLAVASTMPAVKVLDVTAPESLSTDNLNYRLGFADAQRLASYSGSHWTMPPSQLLTQRLRTALSSRGTVLTGADGVHAPVLRVDLQEFEQVFDGQADSHGAVAARATLFQDGKVVGQRTFVARAPASSPDAAGGARALAAASDDLVAQVINWVGTQPLHA
ncbi:ABC-type transport auxiliary lipoprotein family protein [Paraburkholderia sp. BL10I2N1]|uniref:ABC-type transport auxiliary lipoprotein family protein n=1 Tax=Paraburkholderia sp. BL10I2N1 TaxID=1938796 RepID=UPI00105B27C2|nr:ABC-type transport auxiliary lipoprotein family protein [Paraburkholderia sp. BL10I2N1]TDN61840.1 cholesterol transport system auxiliary component [Paraburkholderia sp. BL10I2N1]